MPKPDTVTATLQQAIEYFNEQTKDIGSAVELSAPDAHRPNDRDFMLWWAIVTGIVPTPPGFVGPGPNGEVYPPQMWVSPEGVEVFASAYELAMGFADNGADDLKRWQRIVERSLGIEKPAPPPRRRPAPGEAGRLRDDIDERLAS
jgi:hypothetical protein